MSGWAIYVHRRVNIYIIRRYVGAKTNISKLFKNMLLEDGRSYTAFKSKCWLSQSVTSPIPEYTLVSSVTLISLDADTSLSISEMIIKNRRGHKRLNVGHHLTQSGLHLFPPAFVQNEISQL